MQRIFALLFVALLAPFLLVVMLLVWLIEWENPVFIQERIGKNKEPFNIYKLRTMKNGRITLIGKILRKTGIDELPQLFNIAMGEMNFVGPRPLTISDIQRLGWDRLNYDTRWSINPGITGLAQLVNVCDANVSWQCDQSYIERRSALLDLKIIGQSILVPFIGKKNVKQLIHKSTS